PGHTGDRGCRLWDQPERGLPSPGAAATSLPRNRRGRGLDLPRLITHVNQPHYQRRLIMKRTITTLSLVILLAGLFTLVRPSSRSQGRSASLVPAVWAQGQAEESIFELAHTRTCSLGSLKGQYAASFQGTFLTPSGPASVAEVGTVTFDGSGNGAGSDTA